MVVLLNKTTTFATSNVTTIDNMKTNEINSSMIGRRCRCIFTGMMVEGVITEIFEDAYTKGVMVEFDQPQLWGDDLYRKTDAFARKKDEFGSLQYLQLL